MIQGGSIRDMQLGRTSNDNFEEKGFPPFYIIKQRTKHPTQQYKVQSSHKVTLGHTSPKQSYKTANPARGVVAAVAEGERDWGRQAET